MPHSVDLPYCAPTKALLAISLASLSLLRYRPFDLEGFTQQQVSGDAREYISNGAYRNQCVRGCNRLNVIKRTKILA